MKMRNIALLIGTIALTAGLSGCKTYHVDTRYRGAAAPAQATVAAPKPVCFQFAFQTNGSPNNQNTAALRDTVYTTVMGSGYFSAVSPSPVADGANLHVNINNQFEGTTGTFLKGFFSGLTFGLIGYNVNDKFLCTVEYQPASGMPKITQTTQGGVWASGGLLKLPLSNAVPMASTDAAIKQMTQWVVSDALNKVVQDPNFSK